MFCGIIRRAFAGAWIETAYHIATIIETNGRAFAGAWIETQFTDATVTEGGVAPSRARGLKLDILSDEQAGQLSRLRGRVD